MQTFAPFSPLHAIAVATIALVCAAAIAWRRRRGDGPAARRAEAGVAGAYLVLWAGTFLWLPTRPDFAPATDLPLQLCHWTAFTAALALATR